MKRKCNFCGDIILGEVKLVNRLEKRNKGEHKRYICAGCRIKFGLEHKK